MTAYRFVSHHAPPVLPRYRDPLMDTGAMLYAPIVALGLASATLVACGIRWFGNLAIDIPALLALATLLWWVRAARHYEIMVYEGEFYDTYLLKEDILAVRQAYQLNPALRGALDPVLAATYVAAARGDRAGVQARRQVVSELLADVRKSPMDDSDVTALRELVKIRREMRRDGLL